MFSDNLIEQTSKLPEGVAHVRGPWLAKRMSKGLTIKKRPLSFRLKKAHGETKNCQSVQWRYVDLRRVKDMEICAKFSDVVSGIRCSMGARVIARDYFCCDSPPLN